MDVREKLVDLIANAKAMYADDYTDHTEDEYIAETLLDNFITVWDGKPIEAFLHPIDAYKGLKAKYLVFKADTGEMVDNCFILRPDKDAVAVEALRAYAKVTDNETLAKDIYNWVGNGVTVHEWISVKDRLPQGADGKSLCDNVLAYLNNGEIVGQVCTGWLNGDKWYLTVGEDDYYTVWGLGAVTHWMPLPEPPKGE